MAGMAMVSRRTFLYGSGLAAASTALAACTGKAGTGSGKPSPGTADSTGGGDSVKVGSAKAPLPAPAGFNEAPALRGSGLPAVEDRLPDVPLVLPHNWVERGRYGGNLNLCVFGTTGMANASSNHNYFYGLSPARWLNDGLDIGPGIADRWSSNKDASVWTIHFRNGLKWSDGHPFTVEDILFWWQDIVLPGHDAQTPPPDCISAKGNPCVMSMVDSNTLRMTYDSPQPLVADYLAMNAKGNIGQTGPVWLFPKHYMKQFHPKYNDKVPQDWDTAGGLWEQKADWLRNPDCPTLTGYKCKSWDNNRGAVLERNAYYYVVTKEGDQLPYIDTVTINLYQDAQIVKLNVQQGKVDFCLGNYNQIDLSDVSALSKAKGRGNYEIFLWDSGSGTGPLFFLNLDYREKKYRDLFNDKRFRQAISYGYNRTNINDTLYFKTGQLTTGTMSPNSGEFHAKPDGQAVFRHWRDSYMKFDPKSAKSLLVQLGLKDSNGDGYLEFPDGSTLDVELPYSADISTTFGAADDQLVSDMKKIGLRMTRRPIPAQAYTDQWTAGKFMARTNWEVSGAPSLLAQPQFIVPIEPTRWAPLQGMWYTQKSAGNDQKELDLSPWDRHPPRRQPEPGGLISKLQQLYQQANFEADELRRNQKIWEMIKIHISDGPFFMGSIQNYPQVVTVNKDLRNVPAKDNLAQGGWVNPWNVPCPAVYDPESFYWSEPERHQD